MHHKKILVIPIILSAMGVFAFAAPASADSGTTDVTIEINGGSLSISVPAAAVSLGSEDATTDSFSLGSQLGLVSVSDGRSVVDGGFVVTASATDFTGPQTISASAISYTNPGATTTGTATVTTSSPASLYGSNTVTVAASVTGIVEVSWDPIITVTVPSNAAAGTYTSTITHSVS